MEVGAAFLAPSLVLVVIGPVTDWQPLMNWHCSQPGPQIQLFYKLRGAWNYGPIEEQVPDGYGSQVVVDVVDLPERP